MNVVIFDTETVSLTKPFCYNVGYVIADDLGNTIIEKDFIAEQIWHNTELFNTAYYAEKRPLYVSAMRGRRTMMKKFGFICQEMIRDFEMFDVMYAYAFNSPFDEKVFNFNTDWFKCVNPFDNIPILDIRGNVHRVFAFTEEYQRFCEDNERFTEQGNYSTTAETVFQFLTGNTLFEEAHTALADSQIEKEILFTTIMRGCDLGVSYETVRSIPRMIQKEFIIDWTDGENHTLEKFPYKKRYFRGDKIKLTN